MSKSTEELRAQRKLIEQHLNWLDAQIQEAENDNRHSSSAPTGESSKASTLKSNPLQQTVDETVQSSVKINPDNLIEPKFIQSSSVSDIRNAKVGCILIFTAVTLLFLFLLFGLPYLLD